MADEFRTTAVGIAVGDIELDMLVVLEEWAATADTGSIARASAILDCELQAP